jgi:putative membrane protein
VGNFTDELKSVRDTLDDYDAMITTFIAANAELSDAATEAGAMLSESQNLMEQGQSDLADAQGDISATADSFADFSDGISESLATVETSLNTIAQELEDAQFDQDVETLTQDANTIISDAVGLSDGLGKLSTALSKIQKDNNLQGTITAIEDIRKLADTIADANMFQDAGRATEKNGQQYPENSPDVLPDSGADREYVQQPDCTAGRGHSDQYVGCTRERQRYACDIELYGGRHEGGV